MKQLSQLKVCLLAGTLGPGGAERQLFYMAQALRQCAATPRVLCLGRGEFWEERLRRMGVPVTWVGGANSRLGRLVRIIAELRRDPPQIVQSQHFYMNAYAGIAARVQGLGSIGALRSNGRMELEDCGRIGGWLNLRAPRIVAANSRTALQYAVRQGLNPTRVFPLINVVDTDGFSPASDREPSGPIRLITVGRLIPSKRFGRFLSLIAQLRLHHRDHIRGIIVGDGPHKEVLLSQAAALGLPVSAIEWLGYRETLAPLYREADVFVMNSQFEGTPNVLLEAMACGLPVVATNVGGVPEIVRHGWNGYLVDPDDVAGLGAAVERLIMEPQLRRELGRHGRDYVLKRHALELLPARLCALYERSLSGPQVRVEAPAVEAPVG